MNLEKYKNPIDPIQPKHTFDRFVVNVVRDDTLIDSTVIDPNSYIEENMSDEFDRYLTSISDKFKEHSDRSIFKISLLQNLSNFVETNDSTDEFVIFKNSFVISSYNISIVVFDENGHKKLIKCNSNFRIIFTLIDSEKRFLELEDTYIQSELKLKDLFCEDVMKTFGFNSSELQYILRHIPKDANRTEFMKLVLEDIDAYNKLVKRTS